jgi:pimeloyl-ACP methyl ester carboxylesterase
VTTSTTVQSGNAQLSVTDTGGERPVVFLHAGVADQRSWEGVTGELSTFDASVRALTYDRRGFGRSTWSAETHSRIEDLMAVLDATAGGSAAFVGNSQGGRVALDAVLAHVDRCHALVLIGTAVSGAPSVNEFPDAVQQRVDAVDAAEEAEDLDAVNEAEAQLWLDGPTAPPGRVSGAVRELFLDMNGIALRADETGPCTDDELDAWSSLSQVTVPTLLLVGDLDLPHLRERAHTMAGLMPNARVVEVADCAHMVAMEKPNETAQLIADFLREVLR